MAAERKRNAAAQDGSRERRVVCVHGCRRVISRDRLHDMGFSLSTSTTAPKNLFCAPSKTAFLGTQQHIYIYAFKTDACIYICAERDSEKDHAHSPHPMHQGE